MQKNIGPFDRAMRFLLAVVLLIYAWWIGSWIALAFSIFTFYEALTSWCFLYQLLGKNTCPVDHQDPD